MKPLVTVRWVEGLVVSQLLRDTGILCGVDFKPPGSRIQPFVDRFPHDCPAALRGRFVQLLHSTESMTTDRLAHNRRSCTGVRLDRSQIGSFFHAEFKRGAIIHGRENLFR